MTIDTPDGAYGYHYEDRYWDFFHCKELEKADHWDGYTDEDVPRLLSLPANLNTENDGVKRMTNGDRIRKMDDEELAEFMADYIVCSKCPLFDERGLGAGCNGDCKLGAVEWLKQEVKA